MGFIEGKHFIGWPGFLQAHWKRTGAFYPVYDLRVQYMAGLISEDTKSVLDLGCGDMYLKKYLPETVNYFLCDYFKHDEDTIVCDLGNNQFPQICADTVFMSGILEHIEDTDFLIKSACTCAQIEIILSYCTLDYRPDLIERGMHGIKNNFSVYDIVNVFTENGMELDRTYYLEHPMQSIFRFVRK